MWGELAEMKHFWCSTCWESLGRFFGCFPIMKGCRPRHVFDTCWLITVRWGPVLPEAFRVSPMDPAHRGAPRSSVLLLIPACTDGHGPCFCFEESHWWTTRCSTWCYPLAGIAPHWVHLTHCECVRRSMFPCSPWLLRRRSFVLNQRNVYNLWLSSPKTPGFPLLSYSERLLLKSGRHCSVYLRMEGVWNQ